MAALKLLLSQARHHCLAKHPPNFRFPLLLGSQRSLSSSSSSSSQPDESDSKPPPPELSRRPEPISIQPVSYPVKTQDSSPPESEPSEAQTRQQSQAPPPPPPRRPTLSADSQEPGQAWTREDIRYVKDTPSIAPVSYPVKVAPLPEYKDSAGEKGEDEAAEKEGEGKSEEMEKERRRIEANDLMRRRILRAAEEEKMKVPFPTLIKVKQQEKPPIFDLAEAIRQVKVR